MSRIVDIEPLLERLRNIPASNPNDDPDLMDVGEAIYTAIVELEALPIIGPKALRPVYCASGEVMCSVRNCPEKTLKPCFKCKWHDNETMVCSKRVSLITDRPCLCTDLNYTCAEWEAANDIGVKTED
jgi:hypothetical protein